MLTRKETFDKLFILLENQVLLPLISPPSLFALNYCLPSTTVCPQLFALNY